MRMRKKKHGAERIAACSDIRIMPPEENTQFQLETLFNENKTLALEIGCGKGDFAVGMASKNPNYNFIAMEKVADVCCLAMEKAKRNEDCLHQNLKFLIGDAKNLLEWFPSHSIDTLFLNFSDPWPKKGYAKRRLTHRNFLAMYQQILKKDGLLRFKTDNELLFDFSLEEFQAMGLEIEWQTRDLHHSEKNEDNVMTEYERNFSEKGQVIYSAWVRFHGNDNE